MKRPDNCPAFLHFHQALSTSYCLGGLCAKAFGSNGVTGPVM
jgi:hypothetical protein